MLQIRLLSTLFTLVILSLPTATPADEHPLSGIPLRSLGPALTSGRVSDFAFNPDHPEIHYVSMASGNLWKTENNGVTWEPVFDDEGSYAIVLTPLVLSNWTPATPAPSGSAPVKIILSAALVPVMASTVRWMVGKAGKTWGSGIPGTSR